MSRSTFPQIHPPVIFLSLSVFIITCACSARVETVSDDSHSARSPNAINVNTSNAEEIEKLPQIGPALAMKIVEHRNRYGPFRRPEHLLVIDGIGEDRFEKIEHMIKTE